MQLKKEKESRQDALLEQEPLKWPSEMIKRFSYVPKLKSLKNKEPPLNEGQIGISFLKRKPCTPPERPPCIHEDDIDESGDKSQGETVESVESGPRYRASINLMSRVVTFPSLVFPRYLFSIFLTNI